MWLYLIMVALWGWYAVVIQVQLHPLTSDRKLGVVFLINAIAGPLAVGFAIFQHLRGTFVTKKGE